MKTINLRGVINPLSDSEMKNVKGGKEVIEGPPLTVQEEACKNLIPDSPCYMQWTGGSKTGICVTIKDENNVVKGIKCVGV